MQEIVPNLEKGGQSVNLQCLPIKRLMTFPMGGEFTFNGRLNFQKSNGK